MQLIELDALDAESPAARFAGGNEARARPSSIQLPCGRVRPPFVATTMRARSPLQVSRAVAMSRSLWPVSEESQQ